MVAYLQGFGVVDTIGAATETLIPGATITVPAGQLAKIYRLDAFVIGLTATDISEIRLRETNLLGATLWMQGRVNTGPLGGEVLLIVDNTASAVALVLVLTALHEAGLATDFQGGAIMAVVQE